MASLKVSMRPVPIFNSSFFILNYSGFEHQSYGSIAANGPACRSTGGSDIPACRQAGYKC